MMIFEIMSQRFFASKFTEIQIGKHEENRQNRGIV